MVKLIVGNRGTGKTKEMLRQIHDAAKVSKGNVVCIEQGDALKFDLNYHIRLIDIEEYHICGVDAYYGFIAGLLAGNYDITEIFGDATFRILCGKSVKNYDDLARFVDKVSELIKGSDVQLVFTVSCGEEDLPERMREYITQ